MGLREHPSSTFVGSGKWEMDPGSLALSPSELLTPWDAMTLEIFHVAGGWDTAGQTTSSLERAKVEG